jgi:hypothetical protein
MPKTTDRNLELRKLRVAARALVNVWDIGERRGGEHDLDELNTLIERLRAALVPT